MAALLVCGSILRAQDLAPEILYQRLLPSIVTLKVESRSGERYVGSAFLAIQSGVAVTAWHVIYDAAKVTAKFADGTTCDVTGFIDKDETKDVALLPIDGRKRPRVNIATSVPPVGTRTYVIGSPKGYEFSISDGLLSQIQKVDGFNQYQVSCPFSPGNSGGPIVNGRGEAVGIAAWTRNGAQNVNFATPAAEALSLNPKLPVKRWRNQPNRRTSLLSTDARKKTGLEDNSETAAQFKKTLQKAVGKDITVVIVQDGSQERFTFTVPSEFVK